MLNFNINVNVNANPLSDNDFDVVLTLNAEAKDGDKVVFVTELIYGGVFRITGFPQEHMLPVLFIECPRLLFPFARAIVATSSAHSSLSAASACGDCMSICRLPLRMAGPDASARAALL